MILPEVKKLMLLKHLFLSATSSSTDSGWTTVHLTAAGSDVHPPAVASSNAEV
jgi:hypothetical protein